MNLIIYKITNKLNNKCYIGKTKRPLRERVADHFRPSNKLYFGTVVQKYGKENFIAEMIDDTAQNEEELKKLEEKYIIQFNSLTPNGYNMCIENEGGLFHTFEAQKKQQSKLKRGKNSLYYIGIQHHKDNRFRASVTFNRIKYSKTFYNLIEAAEAYDKAICYLFGLEGTSLNFPEKIEQYKKEDLKKFYDWFSIKKIKTSKFWGIGYDKQEDCITKWRAMIKVNGQTFSLGHFKTDIEAAEAYDRATLYFKVKRNFNFPEKTWTKEEIRKTVENRPKNASLYLGISFRQDIQRWMSQINKKHIGYYETEFDAIIARDKYIIKNKLCDTLAFPERTYAEEELNAPKKRKIRVVKKRLGLL